MRLPLINIIIVSVLTILIDLYILSDVAKASSRRRRTRNIWIYIATCVPCWALLIIAICLPKREVDQNINPVMWLLFTYLSIFASKVIYTICSLIGRLINIGTHRLVNYGSMLGLPLAVLVFIVMWWGVAVTRHEIKVNEETVVSQRLPVHFDNYRIVQISDLHTGTWGQDTAFISKLVESVNGLKADAILFTGDIVNRQTSELQPFLTVLSRLKATDGIYSVLGNHDYGDYMDWPNPRQRDTNNALLAAWQKQMGWKLLNNEHTYLRRDNDSIVLIGVENWGEPPFGQYGDLKKAYPSGAGEKGLYDGNFKLLMTHNPEHWSREVRKESNIDLTLSGHTHAMQMQVNLFGHKFSPAALRYDYWGGMYEDVSKDGTPMHLYVNIGAGEVAIPMRIGATPEITVFTLKRN